MVYYIGTGSENHTRFFTVEGLESLDSKFSREFKPILKRFHDWLKTRMNFPTDVIPFLLRDIFGFTKEDIKKLSLMEYKIAFMYALETYSRRDIVYVMEHMFGGKTSTTQGNLDFIIEHPGIEKYIEDSYKKSK